MAICIPIDALIRQNPNFRSEPNRRSNAELADGLSEPTIPHIESNQCVYHDATQGARHEPTCYFFFDCCLLRFVHATVGECPVLPLAIQRSSHRSTGIAGSIANRDASLPQGNDGTCDRFIWRTGQRPRRGIISPDRFSAFGFGCAGTSVSCRTTNATRLHF